MHISLQNENNPYKSVSICAAEYAKLYERVQLCNIELWINSNITCTDKNENQIFLLYKEIQNRAVAKSYMTNGLLIYGEIFARFLIYEEAHPHI
jgi:hypothetical protein